MFFAGQGRSLPGNSSTQGDRRPQEDVTDHYRKSLVEQKSGRSAGRSKKSDDSGYNSFCVPALLFAPVSISSLSASGCWRRRTSGRGIHQNFLHVKFGSH
jgi:hypothetical protein